jgi:hypothetical protein
MKNKIAPICLLIFTIAVLLILPQTTSAANPGWDIQVTTDQNTTINLTYAQLLSLPQTTVYAELYCYGNLVTSGNWTGVKLSDLLNYVGLSTSDGSIDFVAQDGYKVSIPMEIATQPDVIIAYQKNGAPLAETYRLILPQYNGNLWISLITALGPGSGTAPLSQSPSGGVPMPANPDPPVPGQAQQTTQPTSTPTPTLHQQTPASSNTTVLQPQAPNLNTTPTQGIEFIPRVAAGLPLEILYIAVFAAIMAVVLASFAVITLRKSKV